MASATPVKYTQKQIEDMAAKVKLEMPKAIAKAVLSFNTALEYLISSLMSIFPQDTNLPKYLMVVRKRTTSADPAVRAEPAMMFFDAVIPPVGTISTDPLAARLMVKEEAALIEDASEHVALIKGLNIKDKWPKLTPTNQENMWTLITQLVATSIQIIQFTYGDPVKMVMESINAEQTQDATGLIDLANNTIEARKLVKQKKAAAAPPLPSTQSTPSTQTGPSVAPQTKP